MNRPRMRNLKAIGVASTFCLLLTAFPVYGQKDPGVRGGIHNTGGDLQTRGIPIPHPPIISPNPNHPEFVLNPNEIKLFQEGIFRMGQLESTCDQCSVPPTGVGDGNPVVGLGELDPIFPQNHTNSNGLGTRHNSDQCFACHTQPILSGAGGYLSLGKGHPAQNPMFDIIPHRFGKKNVVPSFETERGPILVPHGIFHPNGTRDGLEIQAYVVTGITTDPFNTACNAQQPDFAALQAAHNLAFRTPLQLLGLGFIESIQDREILSHFNATAAQRAQLGIGGRPNRSNDGTIGRFGWKAQAKSLTFLAGLAYNAQMGITNDLFPNAVDEDPACAVDKPEPNDIIRTDVTDANNQGFNNPLHELPDWQLFAIEMRLADAPAPDPHSSETARDGRQLFSDIGCALCHTPTMQTYGTLNTAILQDRPANLFSDLLIHHMGVKLADNIVQGGAGPDEFRTPPLWGIGQHIFFMHDGRTTDLLEAIYAHQDDPVVPGAPPSPYPPSEANAVIKNFSKLEKEDQQAILDFLRSL